MPWIALNATTPAPPDGMQNVHFRADTTHLGTSIDPEPVSAYAPNTGGAVIKTADYVLTAADCGKLIVANSASAITFTLPAAIPFPQWEVRIANIGAGALSIAPGSLTLDGADSAVSVAQFQGLSVANDGTNYYSSRGVSSSSGSQSPRVQFFISDGSSGTNVALNDDAETAFSVTKCTVIVTQSDPSTALIFAIKKNGTDVFAAGPNVAAGAAAGSKSSFTNLTSSPLAIAAGDIFTMDISSGSSSWKFIARLE